MAQAVPGVEIRASDLRGYLSVLAGLARLRGTEIANRLGVDQGSVSSWFTGRHLPRWPMLDRLLHLLWEEAGLDPETEAPKVGILLFGGTRV